MQDTYIVDLDELRSLMESYKVIRETVESSTSDFFDEINNLSTGFGVSNAIKGNFANNINLFSMKVNAALNDQLNDILLDLNREVSVHSYGYLQNIIDTDQLKY